MSASARDPSVPKGGDGHAHVPPSTQARPPTERSSCVNVPRPLRQAGAHVRHASTSFSPLHAEKGGTGVDDKSSDTPFLSGGPPRAGTSGGSAHPDTPSSGSNKVGSQQSKPRHPLERQWSTSNISYGAVVPGFGTTSYRHERTTTTTPDDIFSSSFSCESPFGASLSKFDGNSSFNTPVDVPPGTPIALHGSIGPGSRRHTPSHPKLARSSSHRTLITSLEDDKAVTSILHDAARITNWRTVLSLCRTHPQCARYAGPDGWTGLHHACNRRCPHADVVEALIRAYPDALLQTEEKGMTPLHYACRFKAPKDVVRLLLHLYPERGRVAVSKRDRRGRTPLYYAVRYEAPDGVVEMLLEVDPSVVLDEDRNADSPLGEVWDTWADKFEGKRSLLPFMKHLEGEGAGTATVTSEDQQQKQQREPPKTEDGDTALSDEGKGRDLETLLKNSPKLKKKWQKVNVFLRAAFRFPLDDGSSNGSPDDADGNGDSKSKEGTKNSSVSQEHRSDKKQRKWRILHAAASIKCHHTLFMLARALHPEQAFEFDENDLHDGSSASAETGRTSHRTALHFAAASPANGKDGRNVINSLLALYPDAARVADGIDGSLPLHLIAENERKVHWIHDGIRDLYLANTDAVKTPDKNGRTPLHRAAAAVVHSSPPNESTSPTAAGGVGGEIGSVTRNLLELHPRAASMPDATGRLPLHLIAEHGESWDADAEAILAANPTAVRTRAGSDAYSRLPIHMAASSPDAGPTLIGRLIETNPRGVSVADRLGKLPLHLACESGKTWDAGVGAIYGAYSRAIREAECNSRKWTALHMAAASPNASAALINKLAELYPEAAGARDARGRYPLHLACTSGKSWESGGLKSIFDAYPDALLAEDDAGLLPIHAAALSYCSSSSSSSPADDTVSEQQPKEEEEGAEGEYVLTLSFSSSSDAEDSRHHDASRSVDAVDDLTKIDVLFHLLKEQPFVLPLH